MQKRVFKWIKVSLVLFAMGLMSACQDDAETSGTGEVDFEITDAPSDDPSIKSVMVTVAEVKVNGKAVEGFTKQTIDLKAYQEGNTKLLGSAQMESKTYSNITLVLDLDRDANGNEPGCYVLTNDQVKYKLKSTASGTTEVVINQSWAAAKEAKTRVVMDFDLRKSIAYTDNEAERYRFVGESNLNAAVRVVTREHSGAIKGSYENESEVEAEKIIVYAYKKGTFNAATESQPQTSDGIYFKNAVASAEVKSSITGDKFILAFMDEGEYELHFAAYNKNATTGRYTFSGRLQSETTVNGTVGNIIKVDAGASVDISASIKGVI